MLAALIAVRAWRCAVYIEGDQLVYRAVRTRRIDRVDIRHLISRRARVRTNEHRLIVWAQLTDVAVSA